MVPSPFAFADLPGCLSTAFLSPALPPSGAATVLVVEDDPLLAELAAEVIAEAGYRVLVADDADRAEGMLARGAVDLLFTDIDLARGTNGLDLARRARRRLPDLPVLYASGGRWTLGDEAVAGSVFFPKPYRLEDVVATIAGALSRRA
jgi:DNA-binding response OmpR family regulator